MTIQAHTKQQTVETTTLEIEHPEHYALLEERFRLVRYVLPDALRYRRNPTDFGRVHNTIRDQIDYPYKSFKYDELDGQKNKRWVVYVLYPRKAQVREVKLNWFADTPLPWREVLFSDVPLHLLLKLLQIRFFRGEDTKRFVGQDKCYVYARSGAADFHYCVEVELRGAPTNREDAPTQEFRIIPHATRFGRVEPPFQLWRPLFGKHTVGDKFFFIQLKSGVAEQESAVYEIVTFPGKRAQVKYHDPRNLDAGKGKIVFDFIQQFLAELRDLGIAGHAKTRTFTRAKSSEHVELPIQRLGVVGVYDNRLKRTHPLADYIDLLNGLCTEIRFVTMENISNAPEGGALVLLDAKGEDFEEDGLLFEESDPYRALYAAHPDIPKQSLNVNPNDPDALHGGNYLDYPMLQPEDEDLERNLRVALSELYLKCAIVHGIERYPLPLLPHELAFIRRSRYSGETFTVALWFEGDRLRFIDLGNPILSGQFYRLLDEWGVDWDDQYEQLLIERQHIAGNGAPKDLTEFDIIVGRNQFIAIEDLNERVLYDYEEIRRRHQERTKTYTAAQLKLVPHYDQVKGTAMLPLAELMQRGLLGDEQKPVSASEMQSLAFYRRLLEYDALLEEVAVTHPTISYQELTRGVWLERIARIFGGEVNRQGRYHRGVIAGIYRKRRMFLSEKGRDVQLYQGIWHDESNAFLVGSPTGMNMQGQERSHLIRRFQVMQGEVYFNREQLLSTMSVLFVRPGQYTVSPYYFHLIDLHVENVLRYSSSGADDFNGSSSVNLILPLHEEAEENVEIKKSS